MKFPLAHQKETRSIPGSWSGQTQQELAASIYNYTRAKLEMYRKAGLMPDMVSIGNEVDTGFLGGPGYYPYNHFAQFAALEQAGLNAVASRPGQPIQPTGRGGDAAQWSSGPGQAHLHH